MRKALALAAAPGIIAGMYVFIATFFGLTMDKLGAKAFLLHLGIFSLAIPLIFVERWSKGLDPFRGKPRWALRIMQMLFLLFLAIFVTFLILSHAASPQIIDGEYVLNNHGKIVAHIFRTRLSVSESLGTALIRLRLDISLLDADDSLVVSSSE
jgi:hypothetical protein